MALGRERLWINEWRFIWLQLQLQITGIDFDFNALRTSVLFITLRPPPTTHVVIHRHAQLQPENDHTQTCLTECMHAG